MCNGINDSSSDGAGNSRGCCEKADHVCWGKDFGRNYSMVYFDALAGTGNIPKYSAYEQFTGKSSIDESIDIDTSNQTSAPDNGVEKSDTPTTESSETGKSDT